MAEADILNGIIARFDDFREEYEQTEGYQSPTGEWAYETVTISHFSEVLSLDDYHVKEKGHPNHIICSVLWKYLKDEIGIRLRYDAAVEESFLDLLKFVYARASKARGDYTLMAMPPYPVNAVPLACLPRNVHECLSSPLIRGSIVCMLLQMDTSVNLPPQEKAQADMLYNKPLVNEEETPFYSMLGDALCEAFPDQFNHLDERITKVFTHANEYVREKVAKVIMLCKHMTDYALLELSLENEKVIKTVGKHSDFTAALTAWGLVQERKKKPIYNNMKEKYAVLVSKSQNDWSSKDKEKYEAFCAVFLQKKQKR